MGISRDMKYDHEDVLEQPKIVAKYIRRLNAHNVLDLGVGKGSSSTYLARLFSNIRFDGIDLPNSLLDVAKRAAKKVPNFYPMEGNYHDLSRYDRAQFDVVFAIESLCHSTKKEKVFNEIWRVLRKDGTFIIIDGYLGKPEKSLNDNERLAKKLTEKGMMVEDFEYYGDIKEKIEQLGFKIIEEEDVTRLIIPTLKRFESLARKTLFNHPRLGRVIVKLLPDEFTANAISGYLMPVIVELSLAKYTILVVKK